MTPRSEIPIPFEINQKRCFPERSLDKFFPNNARNLNSKAVRLHTGWAPDNNRNAHMLQGNPGGHREIMHFTGDPRQLYPEGLIEPKTGRSNLQNKLNQTRNQANKFSFKEEVEEKAANPVFSNRILKMYDPSFLNQMLLGETDPLYNSQLVDIKLFDSMHRAQAMINQAPK